MKKTFGNLSDFYLSREQMKNIKGGLRPLDDDGGATTCSTTCNKGRSDCIKSCHGCQCGCEVSGGGACS